MMLHKRTNVTSIIRYMAFSHVLYMDFCSTEATTLKDNWYCIARCDNVGGPPEKKCSIGAIQTGNGYGDNKDEACEKAKASAINRLDQCNGANCMCFECAQSKPY